MADWIGENQERIWGSLNLSKIVKTHLRFYRWTTDCGFWGGFRKSAPGFLIGWRSV